MNEWEFTGEAASWINERLHSNPQLPFSRARTEQRGQGSLKRRDLTLLDKNKVPVLTGEVKLPYAKDGSTPYNDAVVTDARAKALRAGARFFFTWNVNEFVLWETTPDKVPYQDQKYKSWLVTAVHKESRLDIAPTLQAIQSWLDKFLVEFADIVRGTAPIGFKPPDERFIDLLESALRTPIMMTFEVLLTRYGDPKFKKDLDKWMREEGWTILDDQEGINDNLENASKYACYALVNKLVFYEALLKRYADKMTRLSVPEHVDTGDQLRLHLEKYFAEAKDVTGDYLTVFGEDHKAIENRIPFYSDTATPHWRELINQIHKFDFSKIDYEVIGSIFERLISPEERHKYGKYYTRVEVVDLINSFCIQNGTEAVMDPACGGGTFLVRAYARKKELSPARTHVQLLSDLFGVDVSRIPTHLTTINLATRDLIDQDNYPQIARSDFFDIAPHRTFISLPKRVETKTFGKRRDVTIPALDAIVSNPPYVKQEDIPKSKKDAKNRPKPGTKEYYQKLVKDEAGVTFSGRSDLHCYFWPHSASFLKHNGYLCLLTSSQWLDVEYGFRLQDWILRNFRILAVFESIDEPWFVGARVATAITCLQREPDETKRMDNTVRFVQLRRPLGEILSHDGTTAGAVTAADRLRDEILSLTENTLNERYRARLVKQQQLSTDGVRLGALINQSDSDDSNGDIQLGAGDYFGAKWGLYLRTPDLWFKVIDNYGNNLAPLVNVANIARGIRTGRDWFFYVKDVSIQCLTNTDVEHFKPHYGVCKRDVESGHVRLILTGKKSEKVIPLEARYLKPLVRSIIDLDTYAVTEADCDTYVIQIGEHRSELKNSHALRYILWAEAIEKREGLPTIPAQRPDREWYDLTDYQSGKILCPIAHQYKHIMPTNEHNLLNNQRFITIIPKSGTDVSTLAGILNSTIALFSKYRYGRPVGVEGNLDTTVIDVKMMLVPDPAKGTPSSRQRVSSAFENLK